MLMSAPHFTSFTYCWAVHTDRGWYGSVYVPPVLRALQVCAPHTRCVVSLGDWLGWSPHADFTRRAFQMTFQPQGRLIPTLDHLSWHYDSAIYLLSVQGLTVADALATHTMLTGISDYLGLRPVTSDDIPAAQILCHDGLCADQFRIASSTISVPCIEGDDHDVRFGESLGPQCAPNAGWVDVLAPLFAQVAIHHPHAGAAQRWLALSSPPHRSIPND